MKRIWFASDSLIPNEEFVSRIRVLRAGVFYGLEKIKSVSINHEHQDTECLRIDFLNDSETLIVTDEPSIYSIHPDSLIIIRDFSDMDSFAGAKYFLMDPFEAEADYYIKIWQRFMGLPWHIADTERLTLRETIEEDVDAFYEIYKDPVMTLYNEKLYENPEEEKKYAREYREKVYGVQGFGIWTVLLKNSDTIIGRVGLTVRAGFDDVELGASIAGLYQKSGYGLEATLKCIELAGELGFERVYSLIMAENPMGKGLAIKAGFSYKRKVMLNGIEYEEWELLL